MSDTRSHGFPKSLRLRGKTEIARVYEARIRESRGPLTVYALANDLGHHRLGLSVSTRVGNAPKRNRIKRMLRESFRLLQHDLPGGHDLMVVVRPHEPLELAEYQKLLTDIVSTLHKRMAQ